MHVVLALRVVHLAVQGNHVVAGHAVLGDHERQLVALVEELRAPVERVRRDRPLDCRLRMAHRLKKLLPALLVRGPDQTAGVDVLAVKVQRLADRLKIFLPAGGQVLPKVLKSLLRIAAQNRWIAPPGDGERPVPRAARDGEVRLARGLDVLGAVAGRDARIAAGRIAHAHAGDGFAQHSDRHAVRQQDVVAHRDRRGRREHIARRMHARAVAQADEALRLVEGDEVLHAVAEAPGAQRRVLEEPGGALRVFPGAPGLQGGGVVPMEERDDRADAGGEQLIDERVVERHALLIHLAHTLGKQTRPGEGEAVVFDAHLLHQPHVLAEAMIVVAGDVAGVPLEHLARLMGEAVPDGRALAVLEGRALDLIGRGGRAPDEILAEAHGVPPVCGIGKGASAIFPAGFLLLYPLTPDKATPERQICPAKDAS